MKSTNKKIAKIVLVLLLVCGVVFGWMFFRAFRVFSIEDEIHSTFFPVLLALDDYEARHGHPPPDLASLIPEYLPDLPVSKNVSEVYFQRSADDAGWRLHLISAATGSPRVYFAHQGMPLSEADAKDVVLVYHFRWRVVEGAAVESLVKHCEE
jgi:hypothetical protein